MHFFLLQLQLLPEADYRTGQQGRGLGPRNDFNPALAAAAAAATGFDSYFLLAQSAAIWPWPIGHTITFTQSV